MELTNKPPRGYEILSVAHLKSFEISTGERDQRSYGTTLQSQGPALHQDLYPKATLNQVTHKVGPITLIGWAILFENML